MKPEPRRVSTPDQASGSCYPPAAKRLPENCIISCRNNADARRGYIGRAGLV